MNRGTDERSWLYLGGPSRILDQLRFVDDYQYIDRDHAA